MKLSAYIVAVDSGFAPNPWPQGHQDSAAVPTPHGHNAGHKNTINRRQIDAFWSWLVASAPRSGRIGRPTDFLDRECDARLAETDDDVAE
jgi:hypothetical protein